MRPLPLLTAENREFWTGGAHGKLKICFCNSCERAIHPPQLVCPTCLSLDVGSRAVTGTGTVYSFTVNYQPWYPEMAVPFALAVVDVDGAPGVRVTAQVTDTDPEAVRIGDKVQVGFRQIDDIWLPQWKPVVQRSAT